MLSWLLVPHVYQGAVINTVSTPVQVDFRRADEGEVGVVERLEYDPNRSARIALVRYPEGGRHAGHRYVHMQCT